MLGKENGRSVSFSVAGMANSVLASRMASSTNLYAISEVCTMPVSESLLCGEIRWLSGRGHLFRGGMALNRSGRRRQALTDLTQH